MGIVAGSQRWTSSGRTRRSWKKSTTTRTFLAVAAPIGRIVVTSGFAPKPELMRLHNQSTTTIPAASLAETLAVGEVIEEFPMIGSESEAEECENRIRSSVPEREWELRLPCPRQRSLIGRPLFGFPLCSAVQKREP